MGGPDEALGLAAARGRPRCCRVAKWAIAILVTAVVLAATRQGFGYYLDNELIAALKRRDSSAALRCLRMGADPNAQSYTEFWSPVDLFREWSVGRTYRRYSLSALMLAAIGGRKDVATELIARGADP